MESGTRFVRVLLRPKMCEITFLVSLFAVFWVWVGAGLLGGGFWERVHGVNSHLAVLVGVAGDASVEDMVVMDETGR